MSTLSPCYIFPSAAAALAEDDGNIASGARRRPRPSPASSSSTNLRGHPTSLACLVHLFLPPLRMPTALGWERKGRKIEGGSVQTDREAADQRKHVYSIQSTADANFQGREAHAAAGAFATFIPFPFLCPEAKPFFVCLSVCAEVFDEFLLPSLSCFSTQFRCSKLCLKTAISRI